MAGLAILSLLRLSNAKLQFLVINLAFIFIFALVYWVFGTPQHFKSQFTSDYLSFLDALYLSFTTHCTLGYGDIVPISGLMRIVNIIHTVFMIAYLFLVSL